MQSMRTVPLARILDHVKAPALVDYLSLDVEGAEELALLGFPFDRYSFRVMSIERPSPALRSRLEAQRYHHICDNSRIDELWVHHRLLLSTALAGVPKRTASWPDRNCSARLGLVS